MKNKENTSLVRRFGRLLYLKLIVPLKRSKHPVSYTARGVLVGMMWAMTPLVGIQMTTVWFTWISAKFLFKWDFSLPVALAWTWVTNVFTMFPIYYLFYITGKLMMGQFDSISAFAPFADAIKEVFSTGVSFWQIIEALELFAKILIQDWGLAMAIGCLPWSIVCGWISYKMTLKWLDKREQKKKNAEERRAFWRGRLHKGKKNVSK